MWARHPGLLSGALTGLLRYDTVQPRAPRRATITILLLLAVSALEVAYVGSSPWADIFRPFRASALRYRSTQGSSPGFDHHFVVVGSVGAGGSLRGLVTLGCCLAPFQGFQWNMHIQPRAPRRTAITISLLLAVSALEVAYVGSLPWAVVWRPYRAFNGICTFNPGLLAGLRSASRCCWQCRRWR